MRRDGIQTFVRRTKPTGALLADRDSRRVLHVTASGAHLLGHARTDILGLSLDQVLAGTVGGAWFNDEASLLDGVNPPASPPPGGGESQSDAWFRCFRIADAPTALIWIQLQQLPQLDAARKVAEQQVAIAVRTFTKVVRTRDLATDCHQTGVTRLAGRIAQQLELTIDEQAGVMCAAAVHDIGKLAIPIEILHFPGRLTEPAMTMVRSHAMLGHHLLSGLSEPWPIADIALQHHERANGSGYPNALTADAIHPFARIVAVADVIDAMLTHRPYHAARPLPTVLSEIEGGADTIYDPDVARAAVAVLRG